jgi:hypothetical protein
MFYEYLKNTLLETVNKKYPVSVEEKKMVAPINIINQFHEIDLLY